MKKALLTILEPRTATFLTVFALGFGITVHPVFLIIALLIGIAAMVETAVNAAMTHRHL